MDTAFVSWHCKKIVAWLLVAVWMLLIYLLSAQPHSGEATEQVFKSFNVLVRKLGHLTEYAVLFLLSRRAFALSGKRLWARFDITCLLALLLSLAYAITDEAHQHFVPGRSASVSDVFLDLSGAGLAWIFAYFWAKRSKG